MSRASKSFIPPQSIVKVVAAGTTPTGDLRATVMFTPAGKDLRSNLSKWPALLLKALAEADWKIDLSIAVVRVASSEKVCRGTKYSDVIGLEKNCTGAAQAAEHAWRTTTPPIWLLRLWEKDFSVSKESRHKGKNVWETLAKALEHSNSGKSLSEGAIGSGGGRPPEVIDKETKAPRVVTQAPPNAGQSVKVDAVIPVRQSDLAVLLETQRSLELCSTARAAHDAVWTGAKEEADSAKSARDDRPDPSAALTLLWEESCKRYKAAKDRIKDHYDEICYVEDEEMPLVSWIKDDSKQLISDPATTRAQVDQAIQHPLDSHVAASQPQDSSNCATLHDFGELQQADFEKIVSQRFFAIQGSPALSRLYGFTVDVVLSKDAVAQLCGYGGEYNMPAGSTVFLLLSIARSNRELDGQPGVWTLAKWRPNQHPSHFWPANRCEAGRDISKAIHPALTQFDGVVVLGQKLLAQQTGGDKPDAKGFEVNRFELTSLDVTAASEAAVDKRRRPLAAAPDAAVLAQMPPILAGRPQEWARKSFSTAGISLLDRSRLEQAVNQFAARNTHGLQNAIVLDANDLTVGYRLDVGIIVRRGEKNSATRTEWRSLMARQIEHGTHDFQRNEVHRVVPQLMGAMDNNAGSIGWGETLDDAVLGLPGRMIFTGKGNADLQGNTDLFVEETIAQWTGEPMAAHCAGPKVDKIKPMEVGAGDRTTLPTSHHRPERRPPPLRFGRAYRFGMRAVYPGGLSLPLDDARFYYDLNTSATLGRLSLPSLQGNVSRMRRFLRHERIDLPSLLMHRAIADVPRGAMGYERGAHAIVRSASGKWSSRATPSSTQRIFAPPCVDIHFAALHGSFDSMETPEQGLKNVRYDAIGGGFPYITTVTEPIVGINGKTFEGRHAVVDRGTRGDLVYEEGGDHRARPMPFYPDPAAHRYAVAVRFAGTHVYLTGGPFVVDMYANGDSYPNARLLVVSVVRQSAQRGVFPPTLEQVIKRKALAGPAVKHGVELTVTLAPGEDFDIDVWCIPSELQLAEQFALIEGIGTLALARAKKLGADANAAPNDTIFMQALASLVPDEVCQRFRNCAISNSRTLRWTNEGIGGLEAPAKHLLDSIATALYGTLVSRPLDEVAAVQTLRATHATAYPDLAPIFIEGPRQLQISRHVEALLNLSENIPQPNSYCTKSRLNAAPDVIASPASDHVPEYMLVGDVAVDLNTTDALDIYASTTFPTTSVFDDRNRGRTASDRREGRWPAGAKSELSKRAVFGFDVKPDGSVTLPKQSVLLLRLENLPLQTPGGLCPTADGRTPLRLEWIGNGQPSTVLGDIKARHVFPDGKARHLEITVVGRARHGTFMRSADGLAVNGHPLIEGTPVTMADPDRLGATSTWLDASIRPSEPIALTPIPAFVWKRSAFGKSRIAVVRIPLGRGWFSSGEDEKLGVVLWPPNIFSRNPEFFANDRISTLQSPGRLMTLNDFSDDDLGPGGRFISRWGADPLRPSLSLPKNAPPRTFVDPVAFSDLGRDAGLGFRATKIAAVSMPVPPAISNNGGANNQATLTTMPVSLVTFEPRFDIENEQWYVDAAIEHPYEHQPFLRLGLVRYQEHAAPELQVSFPIVQWVQLLPRRDARVNTVQSYKGGRTVKLVVEGTADSSLATDLSAETAAKVLPPAMTMTLVREYTSSSGILCRQAGEPQPMTSEIREVNDVDYAGVQAAWTGTIDVPDAAHSRNFLYVEERLSYLPANYADEPVSAMLASVQGGLERPDLVKGGPRYSVTVEV